MTTSLSETYLDFNFEDFKIRVLTDESNEVWFVARDVAEVLGYIRKKDNKIDVNAMTRKISDEDKGTTNIRTLGGNQQMAIINESGLYISIFGSSKDEATKFKYWVTRDVLPQIRKTGSYQLSPETETVSEIPEVEKLSITKELEILKFKLENYGYSQKEKIEVSNTLFRKVGTDELPIPKKIETHSFQNSFSLTKLLEKHDIQIRTADFNTKLADIGIIEKRGKNWFILNLEFGINEIYENKTNPKYFEKSFANLLKLVFPPKNILELPII